MGKMFSIGPMYRSEDNIVHRGFLNVEVINECHAKGVDFTVSYGFVI